MSGQRQRRKEATHERDRQRCLNCLRPRETVDKLDADHSVPRGAGGSDQLSNRLSLCRRCHEAKHGEGVAPTVELQSTGEMTEVEFMWFKQLLNQIIPALARERGVQLEPKFNLDGRKSWHIPLGDIRRLDRELTDDSGYTTLQLAEYM